MEPNENDNDNNNNSDISNQFKKLKIRNSRQNNRNVKPSQNSTRLNVSEIKFSQSSVSENFQNGNSVEELISSLIQGDTSVDEVEPIRVVKHNREWFTLDNRRLRAFKNAFVKDIPVIVCNLSNKNIAGEFFAKLNNKTISGGGEIRVKQHVHTSLYADHFESGAYEFIRLVLGWTFDFIQKSRVPIHQTLPEYFINHFSYYESFIPLIKEEARAVLESGIETMDTQPVLHVTLFKVKFANNPQNPSNLTFVFSEQNNFDLNSGDIIVLTHSRTRLQLLGWVSQGEESGFGKFQVKVIPEEFQLTSCDIAFDENQPWTAVYINSLVTQLRMYDICTLKPSVTFLPQLIGRSSFQIEENVSDEKLENNSSFLYTLKNLIFKRPEPVKKPIPHEGDLKHLNTSQKNAILKFLELKQGIHLVQGPPGTGKTTMTVTLIKILVKEENRLLVCAPSNKAVQVIAERFIAENPDVPAILVGVEEKLPEDSPLRNIFIHTWSQERKNELVELQGLLSGLLPDEKNPLKHFEEYDASTAATLIESYFLKFINNINKYYLSFFDDLESILNNFNSFLEQYCSLANKYENYINNTKIFFQNIRQLLSQLAAIFTKLQSILENAEMDGSKNGLEGQLLDNSSVVFATQSVSGRQSVQQMDDVDVLIVDEAGQSTEAENLIPLTSYPKKMILIGDTKQLPATVISQHAEQHGFSTSMMYRLEKLHCESSFLDFQYRMHPEISQFPSKKYYQGDLRDSKKVSPETRIFEPLKNAPDFLVPYSFLDVEGKETSAKSTSIMNQDEANVISVLLEYLSQYFKINVIQDVSIITFYKAQSDLLNKMFNQKYPGLKISTVDSFQGDENKIVILSFVRSNPQGNVGFLKDFRRLNVALTRAQYALIMVGNAKTLKKQNNHDLAELVEDATQRDRVFGASQKVQELTNQIRPNKAKSQPQETKTIEKRSSGSVPYTPPAIQPSQSFSNKPWNYKTSLCDFFAQGSCRRGNNCDFAHGTQELRKPRKNPAKTPQNQYQ